ncbi:MAG: serine protease [Rhizobiaceae bacterium]
MNTRLATLFTVSAIAIAASAVSASAQQVSASSPGKDGEASRSLAAGAELAKRAGKPFTIKLDEDTRDFPMLDEKAMQDSFTSVTRSKDGTITKKPASEALRGLISGMVSGATGTLDIQEDGAPDEAFGDDASRQVFGDDDRIQVTETTKYPFRTIGQLWTETASGQWGSCSATLIGASTIITAAHCAYSHDEGGWGKTMEFFPGINGENDIPFDKVAVTDATILEGFISEYKDNYGSVVPWDLAVLNLEKPVGDELGWLSIGSFDKPASFKANIVGYPGDKPLATMWRVACDVNKADFDDNNFAYLCDTYPGSSGSSVYDYNKEKKERIILGVNIAENPQFNIATRLNAAYFDWVVSLIK